ncbi:MAG: glycoside hydrolase family 127 protein [Muribaculaceae bacterium]|nr:glycoside hydrolase family 127 protein [Muribaculaceae bacterium]
MKLTSTKVIFACFGAFATLSACSKAEAYKAPDEPVNEVAFTQVHFNDSFWAPRIETNRKVSIPSAFAECEKNGRFDNFAIAGGLKKGEHRGDFSFDDTDPYKIIEGASYALAVEYDPKLDNYLDSVINLISAAQEPDGYLTTCVTNKCERLAGWWGTHRWEKINSHELYNSGHLYEAAVAHYLATGKRSLLDVAIKNADLVCQVFGPNEGQIHRPSGHPIVEMALAKLYKVTGDEKYLNTAKYFVEETGRCTDGHKPSEYSQDHKPILQQDEIVGHAVRAGYLYSGVADVASLTNDTAYFKALERIWDNMAGKKLYITGGIGSRPQGEGFGPNYELNNHTAYCETCAAIANVYWNYRMFLATGDAKYVDVYERALYNGVPSGVSLSGDKFFYDNPLESMGEHSREPWFGCACCPGNVTRFMASVPQYAYATQGDDILVNLYVQSDAEIQTNNNKVKLTQTTDFPWKGDVSLLVQPENEGEFALRLRIPGWVENAPVPTDLYSFASAPSKGYEIKVNGKSVKAMSGNGYATIKRDWKKGDKVELSLPMEVRRVKANENVAENKGRVALQRGPVMYCLEGQDQKDSIVFDKYLPYEASFTEKFEPELLNGVMTLKATGKKKHLDGSTSEAELTAIPYCTWNNRGADNMEVWIADSENSAVPTPEPTLASKAQMYSEPTQPNSDKPAATSNLSYAWGYNDLWEPKSSADNSKPYHYWWLREGTPENICYRFDQPTKVSNVDIYWLAFDHYDVDYDAPESWELYYKTPDDKWAPVKAKNPYGVELDKYNHVEFEPVTTTDLKVLAKLKEGKSGGVIEWKVN